MTTILVTGATGTVGSKVVSELAGYAGVTVRAGVRSTSKAGGVAAAGVVPTELDLESDELVARALRGVDKVFLLAPSMRDQVGVSARFIDLAKAAGVKHVVKLSALACDEEPTIAFGRAHRDVETLLRASGMDWTFLRPNNFMNNFLGLRHGTFAPDARGEIGLPWRDGACSFIDARDIAAVARIALTKEGHAGKVYELTGPEALGIARAAEILTAAVGRTIRYVDWPEGVARQRMLEARMPAPMVESVMELHALGKAGRSAVVSSAVPDLTGRPGRRFAAFAEDHAATWRA